MAKESSKYIPLLSEIKKNIFKPIYLLMGNESYYIDSLCNEIIDRGLDDADRDFNQTIIYGMDAEISSLINAAKRYPMMAARQLIVVKEAQHLDKIEQLINYTEEFQPTTILVICYKGGVVKDKKFIASISKNGVVFESKQLYSNQVPAFISDLAASNGVTITQKAVVMMADAIGTDLCRIANELTKLKIVTPQNTPITDVIIEENIGISKEYNNFELQKAIIKKDRFRVASIIKYYEANPKSNPIIPTISMLFNLFSNLLILYYTPDKSDTNVAKELGLKTVYQAKDYLDAMRNYNVFKCVDIIGYIRQYDAKSKGGAGVAPNTKESSLLCELTHKIMN